MMIVKLQKWLFVVLVFFTTAVMAEQICDENTKKSMPTQRYVFFGDQSFVRDRVTGLEWTRCAIGQSWEPVKQQCLEITKKQVKSWFSQPNALTEVLRYQKAVNDNEWRLPTINELLTIVEVSCKDPSINTTVFPNAPSWRFWTATPMDTNDNYAWVVDYENGETSTILKSVASHYIRLVKGQSLLLNKPQTIEEAQAENLAKWDDGIHDLENPNLTLLQTYRATIDSLPLDSSGHPDWALALNTDLIQPRASKLAEATESMVVWQQDIIYKDTATMPWVLFPHKTHTQWLACDNCHEAIFNSAGAKADISMASIYTGNHCGACHGRVAFNVNTCERCHSQLHDNVSENGRKMLTKER